MAFPYCYSISSARFSHHFGPGLSGGSFHLCHILGPKRAAHNSTPLLNLWSARCVKLEVDAIKFLNWQVD